MARSSRSWTRGRRPRSRCCRTTWSRSAFTERGALLLLAHRGRERYANQQAFRRQEAADRLTSRLLPVPDEHPMAPTLEGFSGLLDALNVELKPCLRNRYIAGTDILAETGLCRLRQRPQGKSLGARKRLGVQITARLFLESEAEIAGIKLAARLGIANDRAKSGDEQNLHCIRVLHVLPTPPPAFPIRPARIARRRRRSAGRRRRRRRGSGSCSARPPA